MLVTFVPPVELLPDGPVEEVDGPAEVELIPLDELTIVPVEEDNDDGSGCTISVTSR